jgi:hypothetical protein
VDHNGHAVARQTHIEFNSVRAVVEGSRESRKSILGRDGRRTSMTKD